MQSSLDTFLAQIKAGTPVDFKDTMNVIAEHYDYHPTRFCNGQGEDRVINEAGANEGSCKIFYFARLHDLTEAETLNLYGAYYRDDVLGNPEGNDHANIRTFMRDGWAGIQYDEGSNPCLVLRSTSASTNSGASS